MDEYLDAHKKAYNSEFYSTPEAKVLVGKYEDHLKQLNVSFKELDKNGDSEVTIHALPLSVEENMTLSGDTGRMAQLL